MKSFRFYIALWMAKLAIHGLKLMKRNATFMPGKIALKICPDFLEQIGKPEKIIGVTGTNGKTTVCNMINDILTQNGYELLDNRLGSNIQSGITASLITGANLKGEQRKKLAIFEIDERSSKLIYPYIQPDYIVCTNLFRDSSKRNAHTDFIVDILNSSIPEKSKLILNADDLISSNLAKENKRVYFGIERLETDTKESINIVHDIIVCPNCSTKLEYEYYRYNHFGKAHCPNCDFKSHEADYLVQKIEKEENRMRILVKGKEEIYPLVSNSLINIYNELAAITVLREFGLTKEQITNAIANLKIVETRFSEEKIKDKTIILHLAKGQNPIACSRVMDYVRQEPGKKIVVLTLDDVEDNRDASENITWLYDTDFELLKEPNIVQIIVAGPRYLDMKLRLLIAGIEENKIVALEKEEQVADKLKLDEAEKIFFLHDMWKFEVAKKIKEQVRNILEGGESK